MKTFRIPISLLAKKAYETAKDKGFWTASTNLIEKRMLIICELAEAVEAHRKDRFADEDSLLDDYTDRCSDGALKMLEKKKELKIISFEDSKIFKEVYEKHIRGTVEEELADAFIRCLDLIARTYELFDIKLSQLDEHIKKPHGASFVDNFAENCYTIEREVKEKQTEKVLSMLLDFGEHLDIELLEHVTMKMTYNNFRAKLHGKKY